MESTSTIIPTSTNYIQWKSHMEDLLRIKGLYIIIVGIETTPIDAKKRDKWDNKNDSAHGLVGMYISLDLRFHLQRLQSPVES